MTQPTLHCAANATVETTASKISIVMAEENLCIRGST